MARVDPGVHGVLLLDKPLGLSSNAALQRARKLFGWPKAGHTGTLDPLATGLLPVCFGEATKYSHALLDADKQYEAVVRLGMTSTTGDAEGTLEQGAAPQVDEAGLAATLARFQGAISQLPPMHSALKRNGRPLYDYARAGESVVREPRNVLIKSIQLLDFNNTDQFSMRVDCSKGTYIRVLAEDIGKALGCGGYLAALRRTGIGGVGLREAVGLETLESLPENQRPGLLKPVDALLNDIPVVNLDQEGALRVSQGLPAPAAGAEPGLCRLYSADGRFLGIGLAGGDGTVAPKRMIRTASGGSGPAVSP